MLDAGFSKFSSSNLTESELGKALSFEKKIFSSHVNQESHKLDNAEEVLEELTTSDNYIYGSYHTKADNSVFAVRF